MKRTQGGYSILPKYVLIALSFFSMAQPVQAEDAHISGMVGYWYGQPDLTLRKGSEILETLNHTWTDPCGHGTQWSARWEGFVTGPITGTVFLRVATDQAVAITMDGKEIVRVDNGTAEGSLAVDSGTAYPVAIEFRKARIGDASLRVTWRWDNVADTDIPAAAVYHTREQERAMDYEPMVVTREQIDQLDRSHFKTVPIRHVPVFQERGRFAAWPANGGVWAWGREILVCFTTAYYEESRDGHSFDRNRPVARVLARSLDGGETWALEHPAEIEKNKPDGPAPTPIDFSHPDIAMRCSNELFWISYDRGRTWQGPFALPDLGGPLTSRTDYIATGPEECLLFLSQKSPRIEAGMPDRAFCARMSRGGAVTFLGWMTGESDTARSVMPSTVRCSDLHLVSAMRRKRDIVKDNREVEENWIDTYESRDGGKKWDFLSRVADTDTGEHNGNPPSMTRFPDGRLCVTYGFRAFPYGIRAKLSSDNGRTWGDEIHLRDDGRSWDMGYTRTVARPDGKVVTIYYFTTPEFPEQHIVASIWNPPPASQIKE